MEHTKTEDTQRNHTEPDYTEKDTMDKKQNEGMEDFIASAIRRKNEEVQTLRLETHRLKNGAQVPLFHFPLLDQTGRSVIVLPHDTVVSAKGFSPV